MAFVIKYADNIWKGFATAGAIILTGMVAPLLHLGAPPTLKLLMGTVLVIAALFMYALPPAKRARASSPAGKDRDGDLDPKGLEKGLLAPRAAPAAARASAHALQRSNA